ncbi:PEP-utilizing enzyme [Candidatus Poriferisocius sp.]|uniref:PEP-utilizing enzyme n=1 Tax=Candidatus Poriferisocius sp. TaxID=3101276 RepID=UPI003B01D49C
MDLDSSPVHTRSHPTTRWSRANFAEAVQGVQTPLGWTFWDHVAETSVRQCFADIGGIAAKDAPPPADPNLKFNASFFGLPAGNVTFFHSIGESLPGTSGDVVIKQMFGEEPGVVTPSARGSLLRPVIAGLKMPAAAIRSTRRVVTVHDQVADWWRRRVLEQPPDDLAGAQRLLAEAAEWFIRVGRHHATVSLIGQALVEQVELVVEQAFGDRTRTSDVLTGLGGMEETRLMTAIWEAAQGQSDIASIIAAFGFHGPDEGNVTSVSWREDDGPVRDLVANYEDAEVRDPRERERERTTKREVVERELLDALDPFRRQRAKIVLRLARTLVPRREVGKAGFLMAIDGARCATRCAGSEMARARTLDEPDDIFFVTFDELASGGQIDPATIESRKRHHRHFEGLTVAQAWTGNPDPIEDPDAGEAGAPRTKPPGNGVQGIGVVGGTVRGRARVLDDPTSGPLAPGEILVCRTTDPSWTPLFLIADALVIDTGGSMSHGAIVARELGVTCVINTIDGTAAIPDGAMIEVNGNDGTAVIVDG